MYRLESGGDREEPYPSPTPGELYCCEVAVPHTKEVERPDRKDRKNLQ